MVEILFVDERLEDEYHYSEDQNGRGKIVGIKMV